MTTQAQQVMAHTVATTSYILPTQYNGHGILTGTLSEGGALWDDSKEMFPDCKWENELSQIVFVDGSTIKFIKSPVSSFDMTYKVV